MAGLEADCMADVVSEQLVKFVRIRAVQAAPPNSGWGYYAIHILRVTRFRRTRPHD